MSRTLRHFICATLLSFSAMSLAGQCTGNLGDNIFLDGDFGSGVDNVNQNDPGIAPGFTYNRNPPPSDGFYVITNNTGGPEWNGRFNSWAAFRDNSNDPNGYMMIVNANFEPGRFYENQVDGLCENTEYQFAADVRNLLLPNSNQLLPNVSFSINGVVQFTTGPVPEDNRWNTYSFSFSTGPGQTSVLLALSNNAPGGIGNDLALDNISFRACGPEALIEGEDQVDICEDGNSTTLTATINGDQYANPVFQWQISPDGENDWTDIPGENGREFQHTDLRSGLYFYRYLLAAAPQNLLNNKCRVISNTKTIFVIPKQFELADTICQGLTFNVGDTDYSTTGTFVDTLLSSRGCDSILTLNLVVVPDPGLVPEFAIIDPSCADFADGSIALTGVRNANEPTSFIFNGEPVTEPFQGGLAPATYDYVVSDRFGCAAAGAIVLDTPSPFSIDLGPDRSVDLGEQLLLTVNSTDTVATYQYTPMIDCTDDCGRLSFRPAESGILRLTATNGAGCIAIDSIEISVVKRREVFVPNSFSPNSDGVNDRFTVFTAEGRIQTVNYLRVYDRWGGLIFEANNIQANVSALGWDGTIRDQDAPTGIYTYVTEVLFPDGEVRLLNGSVSLIR